MKYSWTNSLNLSFSLEVFQQTVGMPMGTNYAPLLADLFLYSYEADFIQGLLKKSEEKLTRSFNFTFRSIVDVLSLNNFRFGDFVHRMIFHSSQLSHGGDRKIFEVMTST
jgi:hypothetical protein